MTLPADLPTIPDVQLAGDIREGGQAIVARGTQPDGTPVAVKISRHEPSARRALSRELDALRSIHAQDPHAADWLVPVLGHGELEDGRPYVVLPWLPHSLQSWLAAEQPSLADRFDALVQAAAAVARLHGTGQMHELTVHRDLKPANFLVRPADPAEPPAGPRVCLADLGTVKARTFRAHTQNTVMFTPVYAPPEQRLPLDRPLEPSVDVHALGVLVFEVLTGSPPQTAAQRVGYRLPAGDELLSLHRSRDTLPPARKAELEALEKAPLTHFYDLDSAPDLLEEDRVLLRTHLSRALGDDTADTVLAVLLPALERALRADPDRRATSARELLAACVLGREKAGLAPTRLVERLIGPVMDAPAPADRRQAPKRRPKWPLVVGLSAGLGAVVTVGLLWAFWPRTEALSAEEAAELGIPVELAAPRLTMRYAGDPDAHIVLGGLRSKGSRLPPQPLPPGEHRLFVRSKTGDALGEATVVVAEADGAWGLSVSSAGRTARFEVAPDGLLSLVMEAGGKVSQRAPLGG